MKLTDFDYTLPEELIAKHATIDRSSSRLLVPNFDTNEYSYVDKTFADII